jgi:hypothetical protein
MALTKAHPGVVRWRKTLWITDPDAKCSKRAPQGPPMRGGSPWAYLVVAVVFAPVILLPMYVPWALQKQLAGWVPGTDSEDAFKGLLGVTALILLVVIAWIAYRRPEEPAAEMPVRTRVAVDVFADIRVAVHDEMGWKNLWDLAHSIEKLGDAATEASEAEQRGDGTEASRIRSVIAAEINRARRASRMLGVEPDLSFYEDKGDGVAGDHH